MRVFITTDWHFGIYLNNLDQSYIQRSLPGVGTFSIGKVAQNK